jgi:hypothetical protein
MPVDEDGLVFYADSVRVEPIRDVTEYGGMRVTLLGELAGARIPVQADIGFGDAVTPEPERIAYPTLLDSPAPLLRPAIRITTERSPLIFRKVTLHSPVRRHSLRRRPLFSHYSLREDAGHVEKTDLLDSCVAAVAHSDAGRCSRCVGR